MLELVPVGAELLNTATVTEPLAVAPEGSDT